jgi:glucosamine--fructose-6-phosphate aminotransferase (isomerizing)
MEIILLQIKWLFYPVTKKFIFLEEGDIAEIKLDKITIYDKNGNLVESSN